MAIVSNRAPRRRILLDVVPATGGHGARGIGRYVRGLVLAIAELPDDTRTRVAAFGLPSTTLGWFGDRAVQIPRGARWSRLPHWATGAMTTSVAARRAGTVTLHATDPQRPLSVGVGPAIVTAYDLIPLREAGLLRSMRPDHRWVYGRYLEQLRAASHILAISQTTARDIVERLSIPPARVHVVYPVVRQPSPVARRPAPEPSFLVVGALDPHKRPELALEAFARFRTRFGEGRLRLIGPGDADQQTRVRGTISRLGLAEHVSLEGSVSDEALDAAFASATALLTTSRVEGFGLPPVEALLRGTPVVAVETDAAIETVGGLARLVPADADAIADAMADPRPVPDTAAHDLAARYSALAAASALEPVYRAVLD